MLPTAHLNPQDQLDALIATPQAQGDWASLLWVSRDDWDVQRVQETAGEHQGWPLLHRSLAASQLSRQTLYNQKHRSIYPLDIHQPWPAPHENDPLEQNPSSYPVQRPPFNPYAWERFSALLIASGADPWATTPQGQDAFDLAVLLGQRGIVNQLLRHPHCPALSTLIQRQTFLAPQQPTPYPHALLDKGLTGMAKDLQDAGWPVDLKDEKGWTAAAWINEYSDLEQIHRDGWLPNTTDGMSHLMGALMARGANHATRAAFLSVFQTQAQALEPDLVVGPGNNEWAMVCERWIHHPINTRGGHAPTIDTLLSFAVQNAHRQGAWSFGVAKGVSQGQWTLPVARAWAELRSQSTTDINAQGGLLGQGSYSLLAQMTPAEQQQILDGWVRPGLPARGLMWLVASCSRSLRLKPRTSSSLMSAAVMGEQPHPQKPTTWDEPVLQKGFLAAVEATATLSRSAPKNMLDLLTALWGYTLQSIFIGGFRNQSRHWQPWECQGWTTLLKSPVGDHFHADTVGYLLDNALQTLDDAPHDPQRSAAYGFLLAGLHFKPKHPNVGYSHGLLGRIAEQLFQAHQQNPSLGRRLMPDDVVFLKDHPDAACADLIARVMEDALTRTPGLTDECPSSPQRHRL